MGERALSIVRVESLDYILLDLGVGNAAAATARLAVRKAASRNRCSVSNLRQPELERMYHLQIVCKTVIIVAIWKKPNNAKQGLRALLAQIDAKALIPIILQRDQLAAIILVDCEILFAFQVCRRGSDDTALGLGLCVDADGPGEGECWTAWNFVERHICVTSVRRFWTRGRSRDKLHTLRTPSFPLRVPLDVCVCKVCWLLVLVVVVGEHLHSTVIVSDDSFR
jgi:hypothetical protein